MRQVRNDQYLAVVQEDGGGGGGHQTGPDNGDLVG